MRDLGKIKAMVRFHFLGFWKNPRILITFLLAVVLCFLLSDRVLRVAAHFETTMQGAEPFIWTFGDSTNVLPFALLALASGGMIGVLFISRKRKFTEGE